MVRRHLVGHAGWSAVMSLPEMAVVTAAASAADIVFRLVSGAPRPPFPTILVVSVAPDTSITKTLVLFVSSLLAVVGVALGF